MEKSQSFFKSFLKAVFILIALFTTIIIHYIVSYRPHRPAPETQNYTSFINQGIPISEAVLLDHSTAYICVIGEIPNSMVLASGPPGYCFNKEGKLIDYTLDIGDSTRFQEDYKVYQGKEIKLSKVSELFSEQ